MLAFLQLLRLPTVFTAIPDIVLGFVLTHHFVYGPLKPLADQVEPRLGWHDPQSFVGLLIASCGLYLSGMVFNDVFDVKQDTIERPSRPIPSGRVSLRAATILGSILMGVGLIAAASVGRVSAEVAIVLAGMILLYDGGLKRTWWGPVAMGCCRFLNVLLGASVQPDIVPSLLAQPQLAAAIGLGVYIVGVTIFARTEANVSHAWQLRLAQLVINFGFAVLLALVLIRTVDSPKLVALTMLLAIAFTVNRRAIVAIHDPVPKNVQMGVKLMLLSVIVIDASLIFWFMNHPASEGLGTAHALLTAAFVLPALFLAKWIPMT